jgi:hypothetical protein
MVTAMSRGNRVAACVMAAAGVMAAALLGGCGGLPGGAKTYSNQSLKFSLTVPAGWTIRETTGSTPVFLAGPAAADGSQPNVTVVVGSFGGNLDEFVDDTLATYQKLYTNKGFKLIGGREPRTLANGGKAVAATFEESVIGAREKSAGTPGESAHGGSDVLRTVRQRQLYVVSGGRTFTVTATATPGTFAEFEADFEAVFASFHEI